MTTKMNGWSSRYAYLMNHFKNGSIIDYKLLLPSKKDYKLLLYFTHYFIF